MNSESFDDSSVAIAEAALQSLAQLQSSGRKCQLKRRQIQGFKDGLRVFKFACANKPNLASKSQHILPAIDEILKSTRRGGR